MIDQRVSQGIKSNFFMNEAMKQNANSSHKVLISGKRESVDTLIELSQLLEKNNGEKKSTILYRLGEILAFDLGNKNDSIPYFNNIVNNFIRRIKAKGTGVANVQLNYLLALIFKPIGMVENRPTDLVANATKFVRLKDFSHYASSFFLTLKIHCSQNNPL